MYNMLMYIYIYIYAYIYMHIWMRPVIDVHTVPANMPFENSHCPLRFPACSDFPVNLCGVIVESFSWRPFYVTCTCSHASNAKSCTELCTRRRASQANVILTLATPSVSSYLPKLLCASQPVAGAQ